MWNNFRNWYIRNQDPISWFVIGWLVNSGLDSLVRGQYFWAVISFAIAYANYKLVSIRLY